MIRDIDSTTPFSSHFHILALFSSFSMSTSKLAIREMKANFLARTGLLEVCFDEGRGEGEVDGFVFGGEFAVRAVFPWGKPSQLAISMPFS